ncbi:esterase/lipase family protein [Pseudocolwellia sp. HL-MZ7]|uniref:esterase/lipase family protein n=1 Tax=Pseudocolwellia sp. HL-MZ7 TaxID=3400627 RepID=UPI003CF6C576
MSKECVVLLHGMARSDNSMNKMEKKLNEAGYFVINFDYPSTQHNIESIAKDYLPNAIAQCKPNTIINFVTHSLGGIVLRKYLKDNKLELLGRVVMLGPPNKGSEIVDKLKNVPGFKLINGPAGMELGTDKASVPNLLGAVTYPVGIIAGTSTINPILSQMLPNPDDGKVSVENTKVEGMTDHIILPVSHTFLMRNDEVIKHVIKFLKTGKFQHSNASL